MKARIHTPVSRGDDPLAWTRFARGSQAGPERYMAPRRWSWGSPCFVLDANIAYLGRGLRRRGAIVYLPYYDYPINARDEEILTWANSLGCPVVSFDSFFQGKPCSIYFPHRWWWRYNTWEQVTKAMKLYSRAKSTCGEVV